MPSIARPVPVPTTIAAPPTAHSSEMTVSRAGRSPPSAHAQTVTNTGYVKNRSVTAATVPCWVAVKNRLASIA